MLGQNKIAVYFDMCADEPPDTKSVAIEEVLNAYIVCKFLRGATCARVLNKMRHLCNFLRVTGRHWVLRLGDEAFKTTALEVAMGCERIGVSPVMSNTGKILWNRVRRSVSRRIKTDVEYGGPIPIQFFITPSQTTDVTFSLMRGVGLVSPDERPLWADRYFRVRPQFHNRGVPPYTEDSPEYRTVGTLPEYISHSRRSSIQLHAIDEEDD